MKRYEDYFTGQEDWDEGGGFTHESVERVIEQVRKEVREATIKEVAEWLEKQNVFTNNYDISCDSMRSLKAGKIPGAKE